MPEEDPQDIGRAHKRAKTSKTFTVQASETTSNATTSKHVHFEDETVNLSAGHSDLPAMSKASEDMGAREVEDQTAVAEERKLGVDAEEAHIDAEIVRLELEVMTARAEMAEKKVCITLR